jgi:predicted transcriptional regulator
MIYNKGMSTEHLPLAPETEAAVEAQQGGPLPLAGQRSEYVVMRMDIYRELMGVGSDEEFAASVAAIREGMEDVRAGRTRPAREFLEELGRTYET